MKNFIPIIFSVLIIITGCKKDSVSGGRSTQNSSLSFNYNGKPYTLTYTNNGLQDWGANSNSIYINRPDIFGGFIKFSNPGCGYMEPYVGAVNSNANCELVVDSVIVYTYKSGSFELSYSNCETKEGYDIFTGTNYTYQICDGSGTFNLVLKNKEDKNITITNGVIKLYNMKM